ncbi:MAG: plastocyanin/azurin family copper-binding protein [Egibacteraceae bacterium]
MAWGRVLWAGIVLLFAGLAVAGPALMVRDAQRGAEEEVTREPLVVMADLRFSPPALRVPPGTVVVWSNQDIAPHTVTTDAADSGLIDPGGSFSMTVQEPVSYVCSLHPGMNGAVEVS